MSANDLARRVITNELTFQDDHPNWMYRLEKEQSGKKRAEEIIETKKALSVDSYPFATIGMRKKETHVDFLHVSDDLTLAEAARTCSTEG